MTQGEKFWVCEDCGSIHHYAALTCCKCGKPLKKRLVDDTKSLKKLLGIPESKRGKK